jgi:hypothetical protein
VKDPDEIVLPCECSTFEHYILFRRWAEDDGAVWVGVVPVNRGLWARIKFIFVYLFRKDRGLHWLSDTSLSKESVDKLREWLK